VVVVEAAVHGHSAVGAGLHTGRTRGLGVQCTPSQA
jgi:hypothetical protein